MTANNPLEEILQSLYDNGTGINSDLPHYDPDTARAWIEAHYISKEAVVRAIGQDNYITKPSGNSRLDQQVQSEIDGENKLRHRIRKALKLDDKT